MERYSQKPRIKIKLSLFIIGILLLLSSALFNTPLTVHAEDLSKEVESIVNSIGGGTKTHSGTVPNGISYERTGYLCYLLTTEGAKIDEYPAVALSSPGSKQWPGTKLIIKSRRGHTVSSFKAPAKWNCTPWNCGSNDNITTNEPKIKEWFEHEEGGVTNAQTFVKDLWGAAAMKEFEQNNYVIVIETLVNVQWAEKTSSLELTADQKIQVNDKAGKWANDYVDNMAHGGRGPIRGACKDYGVDIYVYIGKNKVSDGKGGYKEKDTETLINLLKAAYKQVMKEKVTAQLQASIGKWTSIGDPVFGTLPNLLEYRNNTLHSSTYCFSPYPEEVIPKAERIERDEAGFKAHGDKFPMNLNDVSKEGVAMMIIHYSDEPKDPKQTTCDEPEQPKPHKAPDESSVPVAEGGKNIVKNYRTVDKDTGKMISDDGCFLKEDVAEVIEIEDESEYKVVAWKTSTKTDDKIPSETWESSVPAVVIQDNKKDNKPELGEVKLDKAEECLYVLCMSFFQQVQESVYKIHNRHYNGEKD